MKKKALRVIAAVLVLVVLGLLVFSVSFRKITVISGKDLVDKCPSFARPGQEVTVTTAVVADGELYLNGVDGEFVRPGVFVFTMPDEDVQLKLHVVANPNGS
ncbi:MAG: hypothetical protein II965_09470 [Pyramidobacter sp.]|nr:hypothetical protein [Pyramidobacter sp.]